MQWQRLTGQRTAYLPGHAFRKQSWLSGLNAMLVQPGAAGAHMNAQAQAALRCLRSMLQGMTFTALRKPPLLSHRAVGLNWLYPG